MRPAGRSQGRHCPQDLLLRKSWLVSSNHVRGGTESRAVAREGLCAPATSPDRGEGLRAKGLKAGRRHAGWAATPGRALHTSKNRWVGRRGLTCTRVCECVCVCTWKTAACSPHTDLFLPSLRAQLRSAASSAARCGSNAWVRCVSMWSAAGQVHGSRAWVRCVQSGAASRGHKGRWEERCGPGVSSFPPSERPKKDSRVQGA